VLVHRDFFNIEEASYLIGGSTVAMGPIDSRTDKQLTGPSGVAITRTSSWLTVLVIILENRPSWRSNVLAIQAT
jgi:hypothetical protein